MADNNNNKKDPIEELFQQKAENYEIPFNEADWMKLEKRLDLLDRQYVYRRRMRFIAAASVLILSLLGYFTYENRIKINQIARDLGGSPVPEERHHAESNDRPGRQSPQSGTDLKRNGTVAAGDSVRSKEDSSLLALQSDQASPRIGAEPDQAGQEKTEPSVSADAGIGRELSIRELACPSCLLATADVNEGNESPAYSRIEPPGTGIDDTTMADASGNTSSVMPGSVDRIPREKSRAAVSLVMGPDLSTVGSISSFYNPGYKLGVAVEYRLNTNLSISTGIIQSEVRYRAHGNDYKPPRGYWTNGIVPEETIGECILLDIPIKLKYNFMNFTHSRFFATAGLSSYIMLNEDYRFNYHRDDTGLVQGWSENTGTRHWMSNMGLSVGYELDVHSHWSIRAEPFVKIPLREVGWGNVKLYSLGSFFSINYKL